MNIMIARCAPEAHSSPITSHTVTSTLNEMGHILADLRTQAANIGTAADTGRFRERLQGQVQRLQTIARTVRPNLVILRDRGDTNVDSYEEQWTALAAEMERDLPPIVEALRSHPMPAASRAPSVVFTGPSFDEQQQLFDEATEEIDVVEQLVN